MNPSRHFRRHFRAAAAAAGVLALLAGCASTPLPDTSRAAPVETRAATPVSPSAGAGANAGAAPQSQVTGVDLSRGAAAAGGTALASLPSQRIVYFDFDSFAIKDDYKSLIEAYGKVLSTNNGRRLVVEGHTDDRGGREYNLALGQKRAEAVVRSLKLVGARDGQVEAVSFGEERPADSGGGEAAWAKNRRAELKDK